MKKFISIPNLFRGVSMDDGPSIYPAIIECNASAFNTCYAKASLLFKRLYSAQNQFKVRQMVGWLYPERENTKLW